MTPATWVRPALLTAGQWRILFGTAAALCSYALASDMHPQVVASPVVSFVLGGVLVALAAIRPPGDPKADDAG